MSSRLYKKHRGKSVYNQPALSSTVGRLIITSVSDTFELTSNNVITTAQREEQFLFDDKEIATSQVEVAIRF